MRCHGAILPQDGGQLVQEVHQDSVSQRVSHLSQAGQEVVSADKGGGIRTGVKQRVALPAIKYAVAMTGSCNSRDAKLKWWACRGMSQSGK